MKQEKLDKLIEDIEEFIGDHNRTNPHHLFKEDIIKAFPQYKKKHIKQALEEIW